MANTIVHLHHWYSQILDHMQARLMTNPIALTLKAGNLVPKILLRPDITTGVHYTLSAFLGTSLMFGIVLQAILIGPEVTSFAGIQYLLHQIASYRFALYNVPVINKKQGD